MVVMSENDTIPSLENLQKDKAAWLYFCPWYQRYLTELTGAAELKEIYTSDYCITLDELPDWDTYEPAIPVQATEKTTSGTTTTVTTQTTSGTTKSGTTQTTTHTTSKTSASGGTQQAAIFRGDVNCDLVVDISDAVLLARFVAEDAEAKVTAEGKLNAECDGKAGLSGDDTIRILRYIAKLITKEEFEGGSTALH